VSPRWILVEEEPSGGCGCLIGGILALALLAGILVYGFYGATWVGIHVYSYFNSNSAPGAYETRPDYFYGCAGLLFVFSIGTALTTIVALFSRAGGAVKTAAVLFLLAVAAFIATTVTYSTYMK
jgi:hypothetical protein